MRANRSTCAGVDTVMLPAGACDGDMITIGGTTGSPPGGTMCPTAQLCASISSIRTVVVVAPMGPAMRSFSAWA